MSYLDTSELDDRRESAARQTGSRLQLGGPPRAAIVADGVALGVRTLHADIEAPAERLDTPAYEYFAELGFRRPYVRTHWRIV